jgi:hypothetical protein
MLNAAIDGRGPRRLIYLARDEIVVTAVEFGEDRSPTLFDLAEASRAAVFRVLVRRAEGCGEIRRDRGRDLNRRDQT